MDANTGNILFKAQAVNITSQNATTTNTHSFAQKTTGLTASVSSSLVGDVQSIETLKDAINDTNSRRAKLMGGLAAASKARTLNQNLQDGKLGSIRAQATIGSQSTKNDSHSYQETNDAANVHTDGNLIFDIKGKGENSTLTVTGSNISVGNNLYQNVEGDVTYQASTQTSTSDSQNSSKGWGAGIYASANLSTDGLTSNSAGFTANANRTKGSSQETTITHTNTQVTVGGTTVNDIGGNLILDGANLDTTYLTGTVGGDLIVKSRQDSYQYTHDQKQAGGSLDVSFQGVPQSASINGGKTDIDASYKQVTQQSGIKAKESTLSVQGQGSFTGGYFITDAGKNQTQFAQGIQTQDIENHLNYEGDAISVGIGIGADTSSPDGKAKPVLQGLGYGTITPTHKTSTTHSAITDQAGLSHISTENFNQPEVQNQLNEIITNDFNKEQVLKELNAQTIITTEFGREIPKQIGDYAQTKELELLAQGNIEEAKKWSEGGVYRVALHTAAGLLATGTIEGTLSTGAVAGIAPKLNEIQAKLTEKLTEQGFEKETAESISNSALTLLIMGAGTSTGLDTSSTAYAVNTDVNNRQLHPTEKELAKFLFEKAKREGLKTADGEEYTLEQFEDALRLANHRGYGELYNANTVIEGGLNPDGTTWIYVPPEELWHYDGVSDENLFDIRLWSLNYDNNREFKALQNLGSLHKPDENLIRFIKANDIQNDYSWTDGWVQPYKPSFIETHTPKNAPTSTYPEWAIKSRNEFIANNHIDLSSSSQAKSDKLMNERVMPVVETTVAIGGATAITAGCVATGGTLCAVVAGGSIVMAGDTAITQADNFGKPVSQHDASKLLQGAGLSKDEAQIAKLATEAAMGVGAVKGVVNAKNAKQVAQAQKQIDVARVENNVGRDEDVFYKPIKITGEPKDLKEYNDASKFTYLNDGGEFKFSETKNQQGIEGYFVNQLGDKIPISLKNLETSSPRKVMTVINKNAKSILEAEALPSNNPHKLPIGTLNDTVLHIQTPNISKQQLVDELTNYPFQGNGGKYKIIIFETKDGGFTLQNGKIESYPK